MHQQGGHIGHTQLPADGEEGPLGALDLPGQGRGGGHTGDIQQDEHQHGEGGQGGKAGHGRGHLSAGSGEGKAVEHGQGGDHHLLGNEACEQSHRCLPEAEAHGGEDGGDPSADGAQHGGGGVIHHVQGEVKGLEEPKDDAHQQNESARLDQEALYLLPHVGGDVLHGRQAVGRQLQHKGSGLSGKESVLEEQTGENADAHADDVQAENDQTGPGPEEGPGDHAVYRQLGRTGHEGNEQDGHAPILLIFHGPGAHNGGRAAKAHEHWDKGLAAQTEAPQQPVHDEGGSGHIARVLQEAEEEEQQGSFEIQKLYYTEKINSTPEWEVAGIYADDGISGVHTKKRDGFNQMIQDCKKRKIDLILTKSISRFARNTLDSIQYVRMLKQMGIAVVFEKENINTATMNSEMILTVLSAFAQAESESISQNVARGKRMGYKHGKFAFPYGRIIGYRKGADGKPEIIPEQAEIIRLIFNSYLQGDSLQSIKAKLEMAGALTARGNTAWSAQSIQRILQNEKYCGDVLLQKTFTEDVLTGVHKKNTGQLPQYYIENYHEGIVSKQMFREVQAEIARRNSKSAANQRKRRRGRYNSKYALSERLFCGDCGSPYKRVTWNIHGRKQIVWRCVNRIEYGTKFCGSSPSIPEEKLHRAILKAVQDLAANFTDEVAAQINGILHSIQTGESIKPNLQEQLEQTQQEFDRLLEMSLDFDEDTPFLDDRLKKLNNKIKSLKKAIEDSAARQEKLSQPEMLLSAKDLQIQEYDDALTARLIEKITVRSRKEIEIRFIGGYEKAMPLE